MGINFVQKRVTGIESVMMDESLRSSLDPSLTLYSECGLGQRKSE